MSTSTDDTESDPQNIQAMHIAKQVPLVHVIQGEKLANVFSSPHPYELLVSEEGRSSVWTLETEDAWSLGRSLYFYAGRAFHKTGGVALAFGAEAESRHTGGVTPFDTGDMFHKTIPCPFTDDVACATFVQEQAITLSEWRKKFALFIESYFDPLSDYWQGIPCRPDPEGIYSRCSKEQWSAWTFEVRFHENHDILDTLIWCAKQDAHEHILRAIESVSDLDRMELEEWFLKHRIDLAADLDYDQQMESWIQELVRL